MADFSAEINEDGQMVITVPVLYGIGIRNLLINDIEKLDADPSYCADLGEDRQQARNEMAALADDILIAYENAVEDPQPCTCGFDLLESLVEGLSGDFEILVFDIDGIFHPVNRDEPTT